MIDSKLFWSKVRKTDKCWFWDGARQHDPRHPNHRYGRFLVNGSNKRAHRIAWLLIHGYIPNGKLVLHSCDVPPCVNPAHLYLGDYSDNMRDAFARGRRSNSGEHNPKARLTWGQVAQIRNLLSCGKTTKELAIKFGMSMGQIRDIRSGERWKTNGK